MRNRELRDFALEAAAQLTTDIEAGAEIPYDVVEEPGTGSVLYRYQPLTASFIGERWDVLANASSCRRAADALGEGAELYLRVRGQPSADDAEPALRAMLERLYEDATGFHFPEERFERVYAEVERTLYEDTVRSSVVATVQGLMLESDRVELGAGLVLAAGDRIDAPPQAVWPGTPEERERAVGPNVVVALERDDQSDNPLPASEARIRFRRVVTALRLFKPGRVALGSIGWGHAGGGAWQHVPIAPSGPGRGEPWVLTAAEEPELRELCELVSTAPNLGRVRWALGRFEMGCERGSDSEALSDYLLALESLLDATDETGRVSMGLRLAALCAEEAERKAVRGRLEASFALEQAFMAGSVADPDVELDGDGELPPAHVLVAELEQHARALLRDVVCGYLSPDLCSVADDVLLASSEPIEISAAAMDEPGSDGAELGSDAEVLSSDTEVDESGQLGDEGEADRRVVVGSRAPDGPGTAADPRSAAWAIATAPGPRTRREAAKRQAEPAPDPEAAHDAKPTHDAYTERTHSAHTAPTRHPADELTMEGPIPREPDRHPIPREPDPRELETGVTQSADWEFDDDPASYSAPI